MSIPKWLPDLNVDTIETLRHWHATAQYYGCAAHDEGLSCCVDYLTDPKLSVPPDPLVEALRSVLGTFALDRRNANLVAYFPNLTEHLARLDAVYEKVKNDD
jgi:hypothetical protein